MIFLSNFIETTQKNIFKIGNKHFCPFDKKDGLHESKEDLEKQGLLTESLPDKLEEKEGYWQELFYNKIENKLFYDYIEIIESEDILTEEQKKIKELENKIKEQEQAILELTSMITGGNTNA